jgi:5-methylcytosine-specific restriction endonuclease McrA
VKHTGKQPYEKILVENSTYVTTSSLKDRLVKDGLLEYKCVKCKNEGIHMGECLSLQLDHINGIRNDHRLENLRILCPNCHSQTKTYGSKNRNGGK